MPKLVIIATIQAKPGKAAELIATQKILVEATLKETGCERYELNVSNTDEGRIIFTEVWTTFADWKAHDEGPAVTHFRATGGQFIETIRIDQMTQVA